MNGLLPATDRDRARLVNPLSVLPAATKVRIVGPGRFRLRCPMHDDSQPSLSLRRFDSGAYTYRCFGCGASGDSIQLVMDVKGVTFQQAIGELLGVVPPSTEVIVAKYDYIDDDGSLLYQVVRYEPKAFRLRRKTNKGWAWGTDGAKRVLYRQQRAKEAPVVYYTEGEKDVHALESLGVVATTNSGGVGGFRAELLEALPRETQLCLVPDNDEAGSELMRKVFAAALFREMPAPELKYVPRPHKDVAEYVAAGVASGKTNDELAAFLALTRRG